MLHNYFKIAVRSLLKNKLFSFINVGGMAISMTCVLIIGIYIDDELKFDEHIADVERKFRVYNELYNTDADVRHAANIPPAIGPALIANFPEIEVFSRYQHINSPLLFRQGEKKFTETRGGYADASILSMLSIELLQGSARSALEAPSSIAISETLANKYFGTEPAIGKTMVVNDENSRVTAVFHDISKHSHLQVDYFLSMATLERDAPELMKSWRWMQFQSYVQVKEGTDITALENKIGKFIEANAWPITKPDGSWYIPRLMPVKDIHLYATNHLWDAAVKGNGQTIRILAGAAVFILVIAALNFINLSTARAVNRTKEVGLRKVVGAIKTQLIFQFLTESILMSIVAFIFAGLTVELALPVINTFMEKSIPSNLFLNPGSLVILISLVVIIGVIAGIYPAFYITQFQPSSILSSKGRVGKKRGSLRKSLVIVQFMLSFAMIIAALVASEQNTFLRSKDIGFIKENVVILQLRGDMREHVESVKQLFSNHPNVISASMQYGLPGDIYPGDIFVDERTKKPLHSSMLLVDEDYTETLGLHIVAGRDFSADYPSDQREGFMITESAAKLLGFDEPEKALGNPLSWHPWDNDSLKTGKVVGVIKDFHLNSLKEKITPVVLHTYPKFFTTLSLRIKSENVPETITHFEATWKKLNSEWPFEYRFLDNNFDRMYKAEDKLSSLFTFFTLFTIIVACLGLFGLVVYSTTQRFKEIAIRKVLGAETTSLVAGLSGNYFVLILTAFAIATPVSFFAAEHWLTNFAYHVDITWKLFAKAGILISLLSLLTVVAQAFKAAHGNPADALRQQ
jgi:putative ABC transport system permease protein